MGVDGDAGHVFLFSAEVKNLLQIVGQLLLRHGDVFDTWHRLIVSTTPHQNVQTGLTHIPNIFLAGRIQQLDDSISPTPRVQMVLQGVEPCRQFTFVCAIEFGQQDGFRVSDYKVETLGPLRLRSGQVNQMLIQQLGCAGACFQDIGNGGACIDEAVEMDDSQRGHLRLGDEFQRRAGYGSERAFAAGDKLAEIELVDRGGVAEFGAVEAVESQAGAQEAGALGATAFAIRRAFVLEQSSQKTVEVVTGDPAPMARPALQNVLKLGAHDSGDFTVNLRLQRVAAAATCQLRGGDRPEARRGAVAEDDACLQQIVGHHTVENAVAAGGVVADRAANRSTVGAGRIRAQHQAERGQCAVESSYRGACLNSDGAGFLIHGQDAVHIFGRVDDKPGAYALPCQRTAAAPR